MAGIKGRGALGLASLVAIAGLAGAGQAHAATLTVEDYDNHGAKKLVYTAGPGERNAVVVTRDGDRYVFTDFGVRTNGDPIVTTGTNGCLSSQSGQAPVTPPPNLIEQILGILFPQPTPSVPPKAPASCTVTTGPVVSIELYGGDQEDLLHIDARTDAVPGTAHGNLLDGGTDRDTLVQSPDVIQSDTLVGGPIGPEATPGDLQDRVDYSLRPIALDGGVNADGDCERDDGKLGPDPEQDNIGQSIEHIIGTNNPDTLTGLTGSPTGQCPEGPGPYNANDLIQGLGGDDVILGSPGNDIYDGGAGDDVIAGGAGNDLIHGGDGDDDIRGDDADVPGQGNDILHGDDGNDRLRGDGGNDDLFGLLGNDRLEGGPGVDDLDGDQGDDILDLGPAEPGGVETAEGDEGRDLLDLRSRTAAPGNPGDILDAPNGSLARVAGGGAATVANLEGYVMGDGDDFVTGTDRSEFIAGGRGDDVIAGGAGNDIIDGGAENDILAGGSGNDQIAGQDGRDVLVGDGGDDTLHGGAGDDDLDGREGRDWMLGGDEPRQALQTGFADPATVVHVHGPGNDTVRYRELRGNPPTAQPVQDALTLTLDGQANDGRVNENDEIARDVENLVGGDGDDTLIGDHRANRLTGGLGRDTIDGREEPDTVSYAAADELSSRVAGVTAVLDTGEGEDVLVGTEHIVGSSFADNLRGNAAGNGLEGGGGDDRLDGGAGPERDRLVGGPGTDTIDYSNHASGVSARLADTTVGEDELVTAENLLGSPFADELIGSSAVNVIDGGPGDDTVDGKGGNDDLRGGSGMDVVSYAGHGSGVDLVLAGDSPSQAVTAAETDTLRGFENAIGSPFADYLVGSDGTPNTLSGLGGDDVLDGGQGDGRNAPEPDLLIGGAGNDVASYAGRTADVVAQAFGGGTSHGNGEVDFQGNPIEHDVLVNIEGLEGGSGDDRLYGDAGPNDLAGGAGNDRLTGGAGRDVLAGGPGVDRLEGGDDDDLLLGEGGDDSLDGGAAHDELHGGPGYDILHGGRTAADKDKIHGGDGHDAVIYTHRSDSVVAGVGTSLGQDSLDDTIEEIVGGSGNDVLQGGAGSEILRGGDGIDQLLGGPGDMDRLVGGPGADILDGGPGDGDTASYEERGTPVRLALPGGVQPSDATNEDSMVNIEGLRGGSGDDVLVGNGNPNLLIGGNGSDTVDGAGGADMIFVSDGFADTVVCGDGLDGVNADPLDTLGGDCEEPNLPALPAELTSAALQIDNENPGPPPGVGPQVCGTCGGGGGGGGGTPPPAPGPDPIVVPIPIVIPNQPPGGGTAGEAVRGGSFSYRPLAKLKDGRLRVRVSCRSTSRSCRIRIRATRGGKTIGTITRSVPAGAKRTLAFRLSAGTRKVIRRSGSTRVALSLRSYGANGGGDVVASRNLRVTR